MAERQLRVLIVDDDQLQLELMERSLRLEGFQVATSSSVFGVSNIMRSFEPDVMLIDVHIPALSGDQLLGLARRNAPETTRFVLYSSCDEWRLRALAKDTNADGWISKSADSSQVAKKLREVCVIGPGKSDTGPLPRTEPPPRHEPAAHHTPHLTPHATPHAHAAHPHHAAHGHHGPPPPPPQHYGEPREPRESPTGRHEAISRSKTDPPPRMAGRTEPPPRGASRSDPPQRDLKTDPPLRSAGARTEPPPPGRPKTIPPPTRQKTIPPPTRPKTEPPPG
jgi:DNA-binding NarL/FixJ family response regulator